MVWTEEFVHSITLVAALSKYGNELFNATVITGVTADVPSFLPKLATQSLSIAADNDPKRFGGYPSNPISCAI